ncbi:Ribonuclease kappa like protein [Argiope bruennichi]|uniref:Ribonuclease kappa like protein n=1 Tax=Argiope bruennichi TaxID=94029 RepID=A0A8T0EPZ9_ARGBR|nr:Ribonuclease kappa like protein [Argiope bruennichi]
MLVLLGIFLGVYSAAFAEDLDLDEILDKQNFVMEMKKKYTQNSYNCLIAACLYVLSFCVSVWQYYLNRRVTSTT